MNRRSKRDAGRLVSVDETPIDDRRPFFVVRNDTGPSYWAGRGPALAGHVGIVQWVPTAIEAHPFEDFVEAARECDALMTVYKAVSVVKYTPIAGEKPN